MSPSRRSGGAPAPSWIQVVAELLITHVDELLADLDDVDAYQAVLDAEPAPVRRVEKAGLSEVARTSAIWSI